MSEQPVDNYDLNGQPDRRRREWATTSILAAVAGFTLILVYIVQYGESGSLNWSDNSREKAQRDGAFLLKPEGHKFRSDGRLAYSWASESAEREDSSSVIRVNKLEYVGRGSAEHLWTASARRGLISANGHKLNMSDQVLVRNLIKNYLIETETLFIDMDTDTVSTAAPLTMSAPAGQTKSVGMVAKPQDQEIRLLSNVSSRYDP